MPHKDTGHTESREKQDQRGLPLDPLQSMELWSPVLSSVQIWNAAYSRTFTTINGEWLGFVGRRLQDDLALPSRLATAKSPEDLWRVYTDFWQQALEDYRQEFSELVRLGSTATAESAGALEQALPGSAEKHRPTRH